MVPFHSRDILIFRGGSIHYNSSLEVALLLDTRLFGFVCFVLITLDDRFQRRGFKALPVGPTVLESRLLTKKYPALLVSHILGCPPSQQQWQMRVYRNPLRNML